MARILFFSVTAPIGGHLRSALAISQALQERGHEVEFVCGDGLGLILVQEAGINYHVLPSSSLSSKNFNWKNFTPLFDLAKKIKPDVIHTFLGGIPQLAFISRQIDAKFVTTICGGRPHKLFPCMAPITVFSDELKYWLVNEIGVQNKFVYTIPGRMNLTVPLADNEVEDFFRYHDISYGGGPVIIMICRVDSSKRRALDIFFEAARNYGKKYSDGLFVHIGSGNEKKIERHVRNKVQDLNEEVGREVLLSTDYLSHDPVKILHLATQVVGMGRSAFEGMALGKPTLILSNDGFGGIVNKENIKKIAYYNFTARHLSKEKRGYDTVEQFVDAIALIKNNCSLSAEVGTFAIKWYQDNLDVHRAAKEYEAIYLASKRNSYVFPKTYDLIKLATWEMIRSFWYVLFGKKG